jgi:ElaB/YqjD/DUF883 family membrane-anchored ribosome-binding protein
MKRRFATLFVAALVSMFGAAACGGQLQDEVEQRARDEINKQVEKGRTEAEKRIQEGRQQAEERLQEGRKQVEQKVQEGRKQVEGQ